MSTLKVNSVRSVSGTTDAITLTSDSGVSSINGAAFGGIRNLIINGAMNVAQRGTTSSTNSSYVCDRFRTSWAGSDEVTTQDQLALTSSDAGPWEKGFRNALKLTNGNQTGGAGVEDKLEIRYRIEAQDIACSGWDYTSSSSYISLSFWVKSSVAQNFHGLVKSVDGTAYSYPFETGSLTANTWTKVTKIIPGNANITIDNDNGNGFEVIFFQMLGTDLTSTVSLNTWAAYNSAARTPDVTTTFWTTNNATFMLTGVQLEVGNGPTEFCFVPYSEELKRCQRYYFRITGKNSQGSGIPGYARDSDDVRFLIQYPVQMRSDPSYDGSSTSLRFRAKDTSSNFNASDLAKINAQTNAIDGCTLQETGSLSITAGQAGELEWQADNGYLEFSSEL